MGSPMPDKTFDQPIPTPLSPHVDTLVSFQEQCHALCQLLFKHLATALQTPPNWFTSRHDQSLGPSGTVFRMLYYPAATSSDDEKDLRAGAHSDFGSITLLFQLPGQPGLEIKTPEGDWASVPVDPANSRGTGSDKTLPILVNIGDLLEDVCPPSLLTLALPSEFYSQEYITNLEYSGPPASSNQRSTASSSQQTAPQNPTTATRSPTSVTRWTMHCSNPCPAL